MADNFSSVPNESAADDFLSSRLVRVSQLRAHVAQSVEHVLGKDEVTGSSPVMGSSAADFCDRTTLENQETAHG
jgi:hypothetical protein